MTQTSANERPASPLLSNPTTGPGQAVEVDDEPYTEKRSAASSSGRIGPLVRERPLVSAAAALGGGAVVGLVAGWFLKSR